MSKRAKTDLHRHPERIAHHEPGILYTYPQEGDVSHLEMREESSGKLFGRVDSRGQLLQCPSCKHDYLLPYEDFFTCCLIALQTGKSWGGRCTHCKQSPVIIAIKVSNQEEAMVEITIK